MIIAAGSISDEAHTFLDKHGARFFGCSPLGVFLIALPDTARLDNYIVGSVIWFMEEEEWTEHTRAEGVVVEFDHDVKKTTVVYALLSEFSAQILEGEN